MFVFVGNNGPWDPIFLRLALFKDEIRDTSQKQLHVFKTNIGFFGKNTFLQNSNSGFGKTVFSS